jgi:hypothetical protein
MPAIRARLMKSLPLTGAAVAGGLVALGFVVMPTAWLEALAIDSGIAAVLPVAEPPLGATARAVLALGGGAVVAGVAWAALYLLFGPGGLLAGKPVRTDAPSLRRADAHPDAPARWPLSAAELPAPPSPILAPPVERDLPADLDVPLAAFDPAAVLPVPMAPARALPPLAPGERLETFTLKPPTRPLPEPAGEPPSIDALLRRLEQGAQRRVAAR